MKVKLQQAHLTVLVLVQECVLQHVQQLVQDHAETLVLVHVLQDAQVVDQDAVAVMDVLQAAMDVDIVMDVQAVDQDVNQVVQVHAGMAVAVVYYVLVVQVVIAVVKQLV